MNGLNDLHQASFTRQYIDYELSIYLGTGVSDLTEGTFVTTQFQGKGLRFLLEGTSDCSAPKKIYLTRYILMTVNATDHRSDIQICRFATVQSGMQT